MSHIKLGVIMDPIDTINYEKDSTLAMLFEAQTRHYELYYLEQKDLIFKNKLIYGHASKLTLHPKQKLFYHLDKPQLIPLNHLNLLLMRKDPPFNQPYIYTTYLLEQAEQQGVLVANKAQSLRDANEKLYTLNFPNCIPPTLVSQCINELTDFWQEHADIVCKPLDSMGGNSIFRLQSHEVNAKVIFETLTHQETLPIVAQKFIPEITQGDKRILMINGEAFPYALARVPSTNDWRGNLAKGAKAHIQALTARDLEICAAVAPSLKEKGLYFVGLDIIGAYLTEINVTSPTGIRELDKATNSNIAGLLFDMLEQKLS